MIDSIARALMRPEKATLEPQKAVTGPGAAVMSWGLPISSASRNEQQMMKDALAVYARGNRWVKRAEMVISNRVGGVKWHLETDDGETVTDDSPDNLRAIRDLIEKPLGGQEYAKAYPNQPSTHRESWGVTSRHMGLCNVGFWMLDEIDKAIGWPKRIFMVRPDRMTPREENGRLTGWKLDADARGGGTDLSLDEVLPFYLDQPDKGYFGTGLVESILSTVGLPNAIDRHALDTLGSGGRLPGMYAPAKDTSVSDDTYDRIVMDLRTIKDMPDSSKRDIVARAPMEFTPTSADMSSLIVTALSVMSRDDTLTHWGVPRSTIGGESGSGLNSGESRKYDEAALWQNAVGFRIVALRETLQFQFLDRLQTIGLNIQLVIEEPSFDDDTPKYETAHKATNLPLTNDQRLALVGLPPIGGDFGRAVYLPINLQLAGSVEEAEDVETAKASLDVELDTVRSASVERLKRELTKVFADMRSDIAGKIREKASQVTKKPADTYPWWHEPKWRKALEGVLKPQLALAAETVGAKVEAKLGKSGKADPLTDTILARLIGGVGKRIGGILDTTRDDVKGLIERGIREGLGAAQLGDLIEANGPFSELRAETIARTETGTLLNQAAAESYREYGVSRVRIIDGDKDEVCAAADGKEWTLDEFNENPLGHPNCVRDAVPLIGAA